MNLTFISILFCYLTGHSWKFKARINKECSATNEWSDVMSIGSKIGEIQECEYCHKQQSVYSRQAKCSARFITES